MNPLVNHISQWLGRFWSPGHNKNACGNGDQLQGILQVPRLPGKLADGELFWALNGDVLMSYYRDSWYYLTEIGGTWFAARSEPGCDFGYMGEADNALDLMLLCEQDRRQRLDGIDTKSSPVALAREPVTPLPAALVCSVHSSNPDVAQLAMTGMRDALKAAGLVVTIVQAANRGDQGVAFDLMFEEGSA